MDISQPAIPRSASPHPPILSHFSLIYVNPPFLHPPPIIRGHRAVHTRRTRNEQRRWRFRRFTFKLRLWWKSELLNFVNFHLPVRFFFFILSSPRVFLRFKRLVSGGFGPQWIKNWFPLETELVVRCYFNLCWGWSWHWWWCNKNKSPWYAAEITVYIFDLSSFSSLLKINLCISANLLTLTDSHLNFKCHSRLWLIYFPLLALLIH